MTNSSCVLFARLNILYNLNNEQNKGRNVTKDSQEKFKTTSTVTATNFTIYEIDCNK